MGEDRGKKKVGLVLAGGGARGPYELGALSVLLPSLERQGFPRPEIILGTSVGAINAAYLAATAHQPLKQSLDGGCEIWRDLRWNKALRSAWYPMPVVKSILDAIKFPGVHSRSLLDPKPLRKTLGSGPLTKTGFPGGLPFEQIHANVEAKRLETAAVVATRATTSRSVVFCDSKAPLPPCDPLRGIEYVSAELALDHVLASAAIPSVFPAQEVTKPVSAKGWYYDGGTRLNTPIKPAIDLGVDLLIIVALHSYKLGKEDQDSAYERPETIDGAAQLIQAVLIDPLVNDVHTLTTINALVKSGGRGKKLIPYILIAPKHPYAIAEIAEAWYKGRSIRRRGPSLALLGGLLDVPDNVVRGELLSYLLFDAEFAQTLIELGKDDAQSWLDDPSHDYSEPPWRTEPPPVD